jgi:hypothetical protein
LNHSDELCGRRFCSLCGEEIGIGEAYWIINGAVVCGACLPAYARQDYLPCRLIRGKEGERL